MALWFIVAFFGILAIVFMEKLPYKFDDVEPDNNLVAIVIGIISFYFVFTGESRHA